MMRNRKGQGLVEYAMIIVLVAMAAIGAVTVFGSGLAQSYGYANTQISSTLSGGS